MCWSFSGCAKIRETSGIEDKWAAQEGDEPRMSPSISCLHVLEMEVVRFSSYWVILKAVSAFAVTNEQGGLCIVNFELDSSPTFKLN